MIVNCPSCKARYDLSGRGPIPDSVRLRCTSCGTVFVIRRKPAAAARPETPAPGPAARPPAVSSAADSRAVVLIAHDSHEVGKLLADIVGAESNLKAIRASSGEEALQVLRSTPVQVLVSDVALPGLLGFEIAARLRKDDILGTPRIILMASIYNHTRYKRAPAQLYGCDDYIEKHHVHDMLVPKVNRLLYNQNRETAPARSPAPADAASHVSEQITQPQLTASQESILKQTETPNFTDAQSPAAHENAQRLARIIVSDIALYSEEMAAEGLRSDNIEDFLRQQFQEARDLYSQRVPESIRRSTDYLEQAIRDYISTLKKQQRP